jgi:pyrroline-5-carboxylate reductase
MAAEGKRVGFIGAGQMAEALARGFINKGVIQSENIFATDPVPARKDVFRSFGTNAKDSNGEVWCMHRITCLL